MILQVPYVISLLCWEVGREHFSAFNMEQNYLTWYIKPQQQQQPCKINRSSLFGTAAPYILLALYITLVWGRANRYTFHRTEKHREWWVLDLGFKPHLLCSLDTIEMVRTQVLRIPPFLLWFSRIQALIKSLFDATKTETWFRGTFEDVDLLHP